MIWTVIGFDKEDKLASVIVAEAACAPSAKEQALNTALTKVLIVLKGEVTDAHLFHEIEESAEALKDKDNLLISESLDI